jgi:ABC-type glycerol-3-phosphate transport system permease component
MHKWFGLMFLLFLAAGFVLLPTYPLLLASRGGTGPDLAPWDVLIPSSAMAIGTASAPFVVRRARRRRLSDTAQLSRFLGRAAAAALAASLCFEFWQPHAMPDGLARIVVLGCVLGTWSLSFACSLAYLYACVLSQLSQRRERLLFYRSGGSLGYVVAGLCLGMVVPISPVALFLAALGLTGLSIYTSRLSAIEAAPRAESDPAAATVSTLVRRFGWDIVLLAIALPLAARGYEIFACPFLLASGVHWPTAIMVAGVVVEACLLASLPRFFSAHNYYRVFVLSAGWIVVYAGLAALSASGSRWTLSAVVACVGLNAVVNTALAVAIDYRISACDREVAQAILAALNGIGAVTGTIVSNLTTKVFDQFHWLNTWTGLWIVSLLIATIPVAIWLVSTLQRWRNTHP